MERNINVYKCMFYKPFSTNKQHKYTHNGYMKQILLYNKTRYNTYINPHTFCIIVQGLTTRSNITLLYMLLSLHGHPL